MRILTVETDAPSNFQLGTLFFNYETTLCQRLRTQYLIFIDAKIFQKQIF